MGLRLGIASTVAIALAGCSFLLSDDFAGGEPTPPNEAGMSDTTAAVDTGGPSAADASDASTGADADAALDPSLVAFWTFDNGTSLTQKDETKRYDMTLTGATIDPAGGIRGGAVVFVGSTSPRVDALSGANFPKAGTLSLWVKHSYASGDLTNGGIFDDWQGDRAHLFMRRIGSDGPDRVQVALQPAPKDGGSSSYAWAQGFDSPKDQWTHVVLSWDSVGKTAGLYVNGVVVKVSAFISGETFDPAEQTFRISDGFVGSIDEVRLYDRPLSQSEALLVP